MTLDNQLTNKELSQKMKELGFPQDSLFYWSKNGGHQWRIENSYYFKVDKRADISAYTVAELGEMLPMEIEDGKGKLNFKISNKEDGWSIRYVLAEREGKTIFKFIEKTEADARAKMLIYLKENNLI